MTAHGAHGARTHNFSFLTFHWIGPRRNNPAVFSTFNSLAVLGRWEGVVMGHLKTCFCCLCVSDACRWARHGDDENGAHDVHAARG